MSFVLTSDVTPGITQSLITAPQIITQDLFPNIYTLDVPDILYNDAYDIIPDIYSQGLPSTMTASIDPRYVTGPQKYEYKYKNNQGVEVILRGTYDDVMSAIDVLNMYPPDKRECTESGKRTYVPIYGSDPNAKKNTSVPKVGQIKKGDFLQLRMNNKTYSGSGAVIMVVEKNFPIDSAKIILFKDSKNNQYQETGGKIDISLANKQITQDTLFENARKETNEESLHLFDLDKESPYFIDIESTTDNTFYRVYLYVFEMKNIKHLETLYDNNREQIFEYKNSIRNLEDYMETDKLYLFDFKTFMQTLDRYNPLIYNTSYGTFNTANGPVTVRGRTMKAIAKMKADGLFNKIMTTNLQEYSPIKQHLFTVIKIR